jgi:malate/lactate dehydrogenase
MKLGIVGTGNVGRAIALAAATRGSAREIVLVNRTSKPAEALATDIRYGAPLCPKIDIAYGDYDALAGAGVVLITSGVNEKSGGATDRNDPKGRLRLLEKNAAIYRDIVPRIVGAAPKAVLVAVTDPPDPLAISRARRAVMNACSAPAPSSTACAFACTSAGILASIPRMWRRKSSAIMAPRRSSCGRPRASPGFR